MTDSTSAAPIAAEDLRERVERAELPAAGPDLLLALDIDGTLIHRDGTLSPRMSRALHGHLEAGTHVSLASGRGASAVQEILDLAEMREGQAVCSNGAVTIDVRDGSVVAARTFDPSRELAVLHELLPEAIFAVDVVGQPRRVTAEFPPGELTGPNLVVPVDELAVPDATRLVVRGPGWDPEEFIGVVRSAGLNGVEYYIGWTAWIDITPEGVSKASALDEIRRSAGVDRRATVAAGDGDNDVDMLEWAGLGVAMGGAPASVVAAADAQTSSAEEDGLAILLEYLLG